jgi:hypothetical protein
MSSGGVPVWLAAIDMEGGSMIFFVALIPATMLTIAGFVVMFLTQRAEGGLRSFGRYLSFWAFTLAALVVMGSLVAGSQDRHFHAMMMRGHADGAVTLGCPVMAPWQQPPPGSVVQGVATIAPPVVPGVPPAPPPGAAPPK